MHRDEWVVTGVFFLTFLLWVTGSWTRLDATAVAFVGLCLMLILGAITWEDVLESAPAGMHLIWFGGLVGMAAMLSKLGLMQWFSTFVGRHVHGWPWLPALAMLALVYMYSHYFFRQPGGPHDRLLRAVSDGRRRRRCAPLFRSADLCVFFQSVRFADPLWRGPVSRILGGWLCKREAVVERWICRVTPVYRRVDGDRAILVESTGPFLRAGGSDAFLAPDFANCEISSGLELSDLKGSAVPESG